jgi:predicted nucleic acid-binding protein
MVLVDTSVWIRSLANRPPFVTRLDTLLKLNEVAGHELVYGELLVGDPGGRTSLLTVYENFYQARTVPHRDVVRLVRERSLHGRGVGWIDVHLLASAILEQFQLWTADVALSAIAKTLVLATRSQPDRGRSVQGGPPLQRPLSGIPLPVVAPDARLTYLLHSRSSQRTGAGSLARMRAKSGCS